MTKLLHNEVQPSVKRFFFHIWILLQNYLMMQVNHINNKLSNVLAILYSIIQRKISYFIMTFDNKNKYG